MITYFCDCGDENVQITLRTSGTEPKIKFYAQMKTSKGCAVLHQFVVDAIRVLLDPVGHDLAKPDNLHPALAVIWEPL